MSLLRQSREPYREAIRAVLAAWENSERAGTFGVLNAEEKRVIKRLKKALDHVNKAAEAA